APVDVAAFLLNEKRGEILKIETRHRVTIVMIPNKHLETPHYKLERLKHDDPRLEEMQASYNMAEEADTDIGYNKRQKEEIRPRQEAVVKGITPDQPAPIVERKPVEPVAPVAPPVMPPAEQGFFSRMFGFFRKKPVTPVAAPAPVVEEKPQPTRERGERAGRSTRGRGRGRNGREKGEKGDERDNSREPRETVAKPAPAIQAASDAPAPRQPKAPREGNEPRRERQPRQREDRNKETKVEELPVNVLAAVVPETASHAPQVPALTAADIADPVQASINMLEEENTEQGEERRRRRRRGGRNRNRRDRENGEGTENMTAANEGDADVDAVLETKTVQLEIAEVAMSSAAADNGAIEVQTTRTSVVETTVETTTVSVHEAAAQTPAEEQAAPVANEQMAPVATDQFHGDAATAETAAAQFEPTEVSGTAPASEESVAPQQAPEIVAAAVEPVTSASAPEVAVPVQESVPPTATAPAPLPTDSLREVLAAAGLTLAVTDPEKLRLAQEAAARIVPAPRTPRQRKPLPPPSNEPLVQVETRR
ncbi:MAG TPA: ribonuclease E/G, partial [Noviherbaspirillum sp.]|nr:ribonuclease E/G [Noviherbaspirillum sp.]